MIYVIIILIILTISAFYAFKDNCTDSKKYQLYTCGKKQESINTLLERIDYANNYNSKINITSWISVISLVITLFICLFVYSTVTSYNFFAIFLITFTIFRMSHNYYDHHMIKFIHYSTDKNIRIIRKKLKLPKLTKLDCGSNEKCMNRFYYLYKKYNYDKL